VVFPESRYYESSKNGIFFHTLLHTLFLIGYFIPFLNGLFDDAPDSKAKLKKSKNANSPMNSGVFPLTES
jgi:hypothetical protein